MTRWQTALSYGLIGGVMVGLVGFLTDKLMPAGFSKNVRSTLSSIALGAAMVIANLIGIGLGWMPTSSLLPVVLGVASGCLVLWLVRRHWVG